MGKKKRKSEPGCIATIFGYLIFVCIIALIIDLIRTHISERAKHNLMVVAIVIGVGLHHLPQASQKVYFETT